MDVYESDNVSEEPENSSLPIVSTPKQGKFNDDSNDLVSDSQSSQDRMRERITYFILFLLLLIVVYGLLMQNYWLIGTVCFPVIGAGIYKIYDWYL